MFINIRVLRLRSTDWKSSLTTKYIKITAQAAAGEKSSVGLLQSRHNAVYNMLMDANADDHLVSFD